MAKKNETKLSAAFAKQLKGMGFNCKSEEDARKQLLAALEKEGIDGMEDESLQTLIDMVSGWRDTEDPDDEEVDETDEEEVDEDEQDAEDLADEVEEEDAEEEVDETDEDEESDETEEDEEEADDEEEEEPEEEQKPSKKATKKPVAKKSYETKKKADTTTKKAAEKKPSKRNSKKLDPHHNEDDRQTLIDAFSKIFSTNTYLYAFVMAGVSVKYIGKNCKRGVFLYDNVTRHEDGTITGNLYLNTMAKETDKLDELGIDYQVCWTGAPFIKAATIEEANDVLGKLFEIITSFVNKVDKRLGNNRKKMEESLEKAGKKSEKPASKKANKPASKVEDEEEVDEVEEQEVKKPAKKTVSKKSVTKKTKK